MTLNPAVLSLRKLAETGLSLYNETKVRTFPDRSSLPAIRSRRGIKEAHEVEFVRPIGYGLVRIVGSSGTWNDSLRWRHHRLYVGARSGIQPDCQGYKIDDYHRQPDSNHPDQPFASQRHCVPVMSLVVKSGGRYIYVINQGSICGRPTTVPTTCTAGSTYCDREHGPDDRLLLQRRRRWRPSRFSSRYQSQGYVSAVGADGFVTGTYLYILDRVLSGI